MEELSLKYWQEMSEADREAMGHPDMGRLYTEEMLEAFRQGSKGPAYDARLYTQAWGFRLEDISLDNVHLWYGETDVNVPVSMGRAMANAISNCKANFYPNETHLSVIGTGIPLSAPQGGAPGGVSLVKLLSRARPKPRKRPQHILPPFIPFQEFHLPQDGLPPSRGLNIALTVTNVGAPKVG